MKLELREIVDEVRKIKKWTQAELGKEIGTSQSVISKMRTGTDWQAHWEIFLKLLDLCDELEIPARIKTNLRVVNGKSRKGLRLP